MEPLKARVRNGRLVLDEPTDLPEGAVVELLLIERCKLLPGVGPDDPDEREELEQELALGMAAAEAGHAIDADDVIAALRNER